MWKPSVFRGLWFNCLPIALTIVGNRAELPENEVVPQAVPHLFGIDDEAVDRY